MCQGVKASFLISLQLSHLSYSYLTLLSPLYFTLLYLLFFTLQHFFAQFPSFTDCYLAAAKPSFPTIARFRTPLYPHLGAAPRDIDQPKSCNYISRLISYPRLLFPAVPSCFQGVSYMSTIYLIQAKTSPQAVTPFHFFDYLNLSNIDHKITFITI